MAEGWHITSQQQTTSMNAAGEFIDVMKVTFQTAQGTVGSVTVPLGLYTAEYVKGLVEGRAQQIEAVQQL